jgi:hypothetical protein
MTPRWGLAALLCAGLTGCALWPAAALNLAAQGAKGVAALALGPLANMQEQSEKDRCLLFAGKGISVTESLEAAIPTNEGEVSTFEPAFWRPEFAREGYPQVEQARTPTEGTLAITNRSILLLPPPGTTSVRIPYELVQDVEARRSAVTGEPIAVIVRSCSGRFDIIAFARRQPNPPDPEMTVAAAAQLKARVASFHAAADN